LICHPPSRGRILHARCPSPPWSGLSALSETAGYPVRFRPSFHEGRSFGFGDQVADPKPPQAAVVKCHGGERCGKVGI
jgi:hypothetical protein